MTLIAYKDGMICADTLAMRDSLKSEFPYLKIARNHRGDIFASSGYKCTSQAWISWFMSGERSEKPWRDVGDNCDEIAIFRNPSPINPINIEYYSVPELPTKIKSSQYALGYPSYLIAAMDAGLSALDAVRLGIRKTNIAEYPVIFMGHYGKPIFFKSENNDTMEEGEFCELAGINNLDHFILYPDELPPADKRR